MNILITYTLLLFNWHINLVTSNSTSIIWRVTSHILRWIYWINLSHFEMERLLFLVTLAVVVVVNIFVFRTLITLFLTTVMIYMSTWLRQIIQPNLSSRSKPCIRSLSPILTLLLWHLRERLSSCLKKVLLHLLISTCRIFLFQLNSLVVDHWTQSSDIFRHSHMLLLQFFIDILLYWLVPYKN